MGKGDGLFCLKNWGTVNICGRRASCPSLWMFPPGHASHLLQGSRCTSVHRAKLDMFRLHCTHCSSLADHLQVPTVMKPQGQRGCYPGDPMCQQRDDVHTVSLRFARRCVLGITTGLSAPMADRPHAGFSGTSELTTKRMPWRFRSNVVQV